MSGVDATRDELREQIAELHAKPARLEPQQPAIKPGDLNRSKEFHPVVTTDEQALIEPVRSELGRIEWDQNLLVSRWDARAQQIFGWSFDEVRGKGWEAFPMIHPDDYERVKATVVELSRGEREFNICTNRNFRRDGAAIDCEWFNSVRRDKHGQVVAFVSMVHDVSARVLAEQQAQQVRDVMHLMIGDTSRHTGREFFQVLVRHLAEALGFRYAFVAPLSLEETGYARTIAFWADGKLADEFAYELKGTPCDDVVNQSMRFYPDRIQERFPNDQSLVDFDAESYVGAPLISSSGEALGVLAAFDDKPMDDRPDIRDLITLFADRAAMELQRVRDEEALRASEARLRVLTEQMPAIIWTTDKQLRLSQATGAALKRIGQPSSALLGLTLREFFGDAADSAEAIAVHHLALHGASGSAEIEWLNRSFHVYVEPLRDQANRIVGTIGVAQDVSEFKRVENSLLASEERFRKLIEHAPEAVVLFDRETGRFAMANPAAEKLFKLSVDKLTKLGPVDLSPVTQPDGRPSKEKALELIAKTDAGETPIFEWVFCDREGNEFPCEVRLLLLPNDQQSLIRASITNVSDKKQREASLKRMESKLTQVARVSTMGELVGGLAHELNQPLYAIQNYGKACRNLVASQARTDDANLLDWLSKITSTAEYAGEILMRLRNFVSREPIQRQRINLGEMIETAISLTKHEAQTHHVRIDYSIADSLPPVSADAVQIQQVLVNLLQNAFDATAEQSFGPASVRISVEPEGGFVAITVADNGPGLPEIEQSIFDAFTSTKPQGLGLGLAISKTIIESHGGTLTARNRESRGAEFQFTLRTQRPDDADRP